MACDALRKNTHWHYTSCLCQRQDVAAPPVAIQPRTEQRDRQREQAKAAQTVLKRRQVRYRKELFNYLDGLDAKRAVLDAQTKLVKTERVRLSDMVSFFKALGGGRDS